MLWLPNFDVDEVAGSAMNFHVPWSDPGVIGCRAVHIGGGMDDGNACLRSHIGLGEPALPESIDFVLKDRSGGVGVADEVHFLTVELAFIHESEQTEGGLS